MAESLSISSRGFFLTGSETSTVIQNNDYTIEPLALIGFETTTVADINGKHTPGSSVSLSISSCNFFCVGSKPSTLSPVRSCKMSHS